MTLTMTDSSAGPAAARRPNPRRHFEEATLTDRPCPCWLAPTLHDGHCRFAAHGGCHTEVPGTADQRLDEITEDCPPPAAPAAPVDPYGTPPLLGVEWPKQQMAGQRNAS